MKETYVFLFLGDAKQAQEFEHAEESAHQCHYSRRHHKHEDDLQHPKFQGLKMDLCVPFRMAARVHAYLRAEEPAAVSTPQEATLIVAIRAPHQVGGC